MEKIPLVQCLRFLAAAMVLTGHVLHEIPGPRWDSGLIFWGGGVDIFFVISGFIMFVISGSRFGAPGAAQSFFVKRLKRVAPPYWFFSALMVLSVVILNDQVDHKETSLAHIMASILFFPWPNEMGKLQPILGLGWTLNYEMLFYVVFAASLLFKRGVYVMFGVFGGLILAGLLVPNGAWPLHFWGNPIIVEFLFGLGLGKLYLDGRRLASASAAALFVLGFAVVALSQYLGFKDPVWRFVWAGLPAMAMASAFIFAPQPKAERGLLWALVLAGDASYALYLSHPFTIGATKIIWRKLGVTEPLVLLVGTIAAAVAVSIAFYMLIEKPVLQALNKISSSPKLAPATS